MRLSLNTARIWVCRDPEMDLLQPVHANDRHACHERPLCHCLNVTEPEVREAIQEHDLVTVRGIASVCGAGGGCTACHRHLKRLLNENTVAKRMQQSSLTHCND